MLSEHKSNNGVCFGCQQYVGSGQLLAHFMDCMGNCAVDHICHTFAEKIFIIRVMTDNQFWLQAEVRGSVKLENLYMFLRGHAYECCGYISPFVINGESFSKQDRQKSLRDVFALGDVFSYATNSDMPVVVSGQVTAVQYREIAPSVSSCADAERCEICFAGMH